MSRKKNDTDMIQKKPLSKLRTIVAFFGILLWVSSITGNTIAAEAKKDAASKPLPPAPTEDSKKNSNITPSYQATSKDGDKVRNFYQVLEDVLGDFEYDLKNNEVQGLKNTSIRNVVASENIPESFKTHLELLVTERILNHTKTKVIKCLPCRSKKATLSGDNVVISSPDQDQKELNRIAKQTGIDTFTDVAFAYQPSGLFLSIYVSDAESGSILWSRSYNSETSRASAFRRGVDYSQIDDARHAKEYEPTIQFRPTIYYLMEKDISGYAGVLGFGLRMMERYDNRKKEVGFEINYLLDSSLLVGASSSSAATIYSALNFTLLFVHAWNLIGSLENYNQARGSIFAAIGGTYASGFLGGLIRGGYEWRLGKHWAISGNIGYRPSATAFIGGTEAGTVSGIEAGVGISALF